MPLTPNGSERPKTRTRQSSRWGRLRLRTLMPKQANVGETAKLEEAVIDRMLELIHAIQFTPAQHKELLRRVALRLKQAEGLHHWDGQRVAKGKTH